MTEQKSKAYYCTLDEVFPIGRRFPVGRLGFWNLIEISVLLYGHLERRIGFGGAVLLLPPDDFDPILGAHVQRRVIHQRQQRVRVQGEEANYWVLRVPRHPFGRLDMEFAGGPRVIVAMNHQGEVAMASCYSAEGAYDRAMWLLVLNIIAMGCLWVLLSLPFVILVLNRVNGQLTPWLSEPSSEDFWGLGGSLFFSVMIGAILYRHLDAFHARVFRKEEIWERRLPRVTEEMHRMKEELVALGWRVVPEEEWDDYLMADEAEEKSDAANG